ncbi:MAG: two-CW domain-containing protein [Desulfatibacillaceae bacterium]
MKSKANCWEHKECGRQPGGANVDSLGLCPAAVADRANGVHGGAKGGRCCWMIAENPCGGAAQGEFRRRQSNCCVCDFKKLVESEERTLENHGDVVYRMAYGS